MGFEYHRINGEVRTKDSELENEGRQYDRRTTRSCRIGDRTETRKRYKRQEDLVRTGVEKTWKSRVGLVVKVLTEGEPLLKGPPS